jgi:hypothetical protein
MEPSKPAVTRSALERVLARAAELQANSGDDTEPTDTLSDEQIVELGREVGLAPESIRQALAEERVKIAPLEGSESGIARQMFGASRIGTQRVVRGTPDRLLATLDRWMQRDEWLRVVRQRSDRIVWEPRPGLFANLRRLIGGRDYALTRANDIAATVVPVDKDHSLVRLEADYTVLRRAMVTQSAVGTAVGSGISGVLVILGVMLPVAVAPAAVLVVASYTGARRTQQHAIQRGLLTLEQVLDRLERGDAEPPSLLRLIESALPPSPR